MAAGTIGRVKYSDLGPLYVYILQARDSPQQTMNSAMLTWAVRARHNRIRNNVRQSTSATAVSDDVSKVTSHARADLVGCHTTVTTWHLGVVHTCLAMYVHITDE
jgi:hypothetical protein